jgi:hypothetical protein
MPKMTISMIDMYCKMVNEQFEPIITVLQSHYNKIEEQCRLAAKKELGIYDKLMREAKLKLELKELAAELDEYTKSKHVNNKWISSKIDQLTNQKMDKAKNGFYKKVEAAQQAMIYKIKLSGLEGDTKEVFNDLPGVIADLTKELKQLPPPNKILKQISNKKK